MLFQNNLYSFLLLFQNNYSQHFNFVSIYYLFLEIFFNFCFNSLMKLYIIFPLIGIEFQNASDILKPLNYLPMRNQSCKLFVLAKCPR